ncbi:hypothetical protein D3C75_1001150 [compost metagenome]
MRLAGAVHIGAQLLDRGRPPGLGVGVDQPPEVAIEGAHDRSAPLSRQSPGTSRQIHEDENLCRLLEGEAVKDRGLPTTPLFIQHDRGGADVFGAAKNDREAFGD